MEQLQDRLARLIELIGTAKCGAFGSPRKPVSTDLTMHHSALPCEAGPDHIAGGAFDCGIEAHRTSSIAKSVLLFVSVTHEQQSRSQQ
jgi:hypothetical protein